MNNELQELEIQELLDKKAELLTELDARAPENEILDELDLINEQLDLLY